MKITIKILLLLSVAGLGACNMTEVVEGEGGSAYATEVFEYTPAPATESNNNIFIVIFILPNPRQIEGRLYRS